MFKNLIIIALLFVIVACNSNSYNLTIKVKGLKEGKIYLSKLRHGKFENTDTTNLVQGECSFTGLVDKSELVVIYFEDKLKRIPVFIENTDVTVKANYFNLKDVDVIGSKNHALFANFQTEIFDFVGSIEQELNKEANEARANNDREHFNEVKKKYIKHNQDLLDMIQTFINKNNNTIVATYYALLYYRKSKSNEILNILDTFPEEMRNTIYLKELKKIADKKSS